MFEPMEQFATDGATHVGLVRKLNEDSFLSRPEIGVWIVADGMGGYAGGDFASQAIVAQIAALDKNLKPADLMRHVRAAITESHNLIRAEAARRDSETMGSTAISLILSQGHFVCLWVGDSRLYHCRDGVVSQLSTDHSLVNEWVEAGKLTAAEAENHPHANVITRAVGVGEKLEVDKVRGQYEPGDRFLLCSDGLTGYMAMAEIEQLLTSAPIDGIADLLIEGALAGGGRDNVTALVVEIPY